MRKYIGGGLVAAVVPLAFLYSLVPAANYFEPGVSYAPNAVIVVFKEELSPIDYSIVNGTVSTGIADVDQLNARFGTSHIWPLFPKAKEHGEPAMAGYYSLTFDQGHELSVVLSAYDELPSVDHVEPVGVHKLTFSPNDSYLAYQWGITKINARNAWNITQGDPSIVLGIPDTGVDWDHPDLNDDIWINDVEWNGTTGVDDDGNGYIDDYRGWDWVTGVTGAPGEDDQTPDNNPMDFAGHGTHVAGIAAAETNNSRGVAGTAFDCRIMALRIGWLDVNGYSYVRMDFAASAFYYAANKGVKSLNCSWGSSNSINNAANYAKNSGVVIVTAAGNDNNTVAPYLASHTDVITVAATDQADHKASFSSYGSWVDVSAPGVSIISTIYNNNYDYLDGTSMAAPFVTGLVGLIFAADPGITRAQARALIVDYADNIDGINPGYAGMLGTGRINAYNTLLQIGGIIDTPTPIFPVGNEYIGDPFPEMVWSASETAVSYHLLLENSPLFNNPLVDDSTIADTTFSLIDSLDSDGTWYWKIRAGNGGIWSDFSSVQFFRLDNTDPTTPVLTSPGDIWMADPRPEFLWQASSDGGSGMDKYILQVDTESDFNLPLTFEDSTANTSYTAPFDLSSNTRYYWRVLARDIAGNLASSGVGTFGIDNTPPDSPVGFNASPDGWFTNPNFSISWTDPSDSTGISMALYKIGMPPTADYDTTGHFDSSPQSFLADTVGMYSIFLWLIDGLGNLSYANSGFDTMLFDNSQPYGCEANSPDTTSDPTFLVSWSEGSDSGSGVSGFYDVRYKDGEAGNWVDWITGFSGLDSAFTGVQNHSYFFEARTYDFAGNQEPFSGIAETQTVVDTSYTGPPYIPGDANGSGSVNGLDVTFLISFLKGGPAPDPLLGGDANGSCNVNGLDVTYLISYFKGGPAPFGGNCE